MLEYLLRQYGLGGAKFEAPNDTGAATADAPDLEEETPQKSLSLDEMTNRRVHGDPEESEDEGPSEEESEDEEDSPDEDIEEDEDEPSSEDEDEPSSETDSEDEDEPSSDADEETASDEDDEGPFYDPEEFKEESGIDRDIPHTNTFDDVESARFAAINKASMIEDALEELEELDADRGAIRLPDALQGNLENLESMTNLEHVAQMDPDELRNFLWESDEFRHKIQDKAERIEQKQESKEVAQEFQTLQTKLYQGVADLLGGEENVTDEVSRKLEMGKAQGREFLQNKIDERIEQELSEDVQEIEEFIDSEEADQMSAKELRDELDRRRDDLKRKRENLQEEYGQVVETYENAFDLAPQVQEAKPKTEAQIVNGAYDALSVWEDDREGDTSLLADDPGAKAEYEAFVKNAMRVKEKFNDLQHPSDWNDAEDWWHDEFKPSVKAGEQKKRLGEDDDQPGSDAGGEDEDDIDDPDPAEQDDLREGDEEDVYQMNKNNLDRLEEMTRNA